MEELEHPDASNFWQTQAPEVSYYNPDTCRRVNYPTNTVIVSIFGTEIIIENYHQAELNVDTILARATHILQSAVRNRTQAAEPEPEN